MAKLDKMKGKKIKQIPNMFRPASLIVSGIFLLFAIFLLAVVKDKIIPLFLILFEVCTFVRGVFSAKTVGVLADERIYYSADGMNSAFSEIADGKMYVYPNDGWVRYYAINDIKYTAATRFLPSRVTLIGDDFELVFNNVSEKVIREIKERAAECRDFGTDGPRSAGKPEFSVTREGIFGELFAYCEEHTPADVVGVSDAEIKLWIYPDGHMNMIDILVSRDGHEVSAVIEEAGITLERLDADGDNTVTFAYEETAGARDILSRIREYVASNL